MPIVVYGISHKTASLSAREHLTFSLEEIPHALDCVRHICPHLKEVMILSTCQRTEWYLYTDQPSVDLSCLMSLKGQCLEDWNAGAYTLYGKEAIAHIMRVANGLDSSLLGEPQILGQIKAAYAIAKTSHSLGKQLEQVMQFVFAGAKKIRNQTRIGYGAVSLPYTAVSLGKCIFSEIANPYVLLIGAGKVIQGILSHLVKKKNLKVFIANRSFKKAAELAEKYEIQAIHMEDLYEHVVLADIVISATSSSTVILDYEPVKQAITSRQDKSVFMMDMAVPRDIAPEVSSLNSVFLYNIDDLHKITQKHLDAKHLAALDADCMIAAEVERLMQKMQMSQMGVCIQQFRSQFGMFRACLLEKALFQLQQNLCAKKIVSELLLRLENLAEAAIGNQMADEYKVFRSESISRAFHHINLGKAPEQILSEVSRSFVNKLLHAPMLRLRNSGDQLSFDLAAVRQSISSVEELNA